MKGLTDKQNEILEFIVDCIREEHYTPTVREIAERFDIRSTNAVRNHLDALERKGFLSRKPGASRGIELSGDYFGEPGGVPIVGRVAAGLPITATENLDGYLSFNSLFDRPDNLYALRVEGDSMVDAGIWDGDFVIVRQQPTVEEGEIAVAIVDEEATVKRIRCREGMVELIPANDSYRPIIVDPETTPFRIGGKVVGIHRTIA